MAHINRLHDRTKWDEYTQPKNQRIARPVSLFNALQNAYGTLATVPTGYVGIVDKIVIQRSGTAAAANHIITLGLGGTAGTPADELAFVFADDATRFRSDILRWNLLRSGFIVPSGGIIQAKADANDTTGIEIQMRFMPEREAQIMGLMNAQTFTKGHGVLVNGTRTALSGLDFATIGATQCVEILGFTVTGHNTNAATDTLKLSFWDNTNERTVFTHHFKLAAYENAARTTVGRCRIRGPLGSGLYVTASANVVTNGKVNVVGRILQAHETYEPTGVTQAAGAASGRASRYFWFNSELTTTGGGTGIAENWFPTATGATEMKAVIEGYHFSGVNNAAASIILGLAGGVSAAAPPVVAPLGIIYRTVTGASTCASYTDDNMSTPIATSAVNPCFLRAGAADNLSMTVWGRLEPFNLSGGYVAATFS